MVQQSRPRTSVHWFIFWKQQTCRQSHIHSYIHILSLSLSLSLSYSLTYTCTHTHTHTHNTHTYLYIIVILMVCGLNGTTCIYTNAAYFWQTLLKWLIYSVIVSAHYVPSPPIRCSHVPQCQTTSLSQVHTCILHMYGTVQVCVQVL